MPRTNEEKLRALLENPRFPDGRTECRLAAEIGTTHFGVAEVLRGMGARMFQLADFRQGWTLRPERGDGDAVPGDAEGLPTYGTPWTTGHEQSTGPTRSSPGFFAGRRLT